MKKRNSKILLAMALLLCMAVSSFGFVAFADSAEDKKLTLGDLPYYTWYSDYQGYVAGDLKVKLMYTDCSAKYFSSTAENYNLKDFSAKDASNENALSLDGFTVCNWQYAFPADGGSVVAVFEVLADGTLSVTYGNGAVVGGWFDWNSLYRVYKKEAATGTVTTIKDYYHLDDAATSLSGFITEGVSVEVKAGDVIYYELGADANRSFQDMQGAIVSLTKAESDTPAQPATLQQCTVGDLCKYTWKSDYKGYDTGRLTVKLMYTDFSAKYFSSTAENYNLKDFTAHDSSDENVLTLEGFTVCNWQYAFSTTGGSVVAVIASKIDGEITWDYTAATSFQGWFDWNSLYRVYKKEAATGTITMLKEYYHQADADSKLAGVVKEGITVEVKKGDVVYYELGADTDRNFQNMHLATISATLEGVSDELTQEDLAKYTKQLEDKVAALTEGDYAPEKWQEIQGYLSQFKNGDYTKFSEMLLAYESAVTKIDAVKPDTLENVKEELNGKMQTFFNSLTEDRYTSEGWQTIKGAYDEYTAQVESLSEVSAVKTLYNEKLSVMKSVKVIIDSMNYLDYPAKMNANGYTWIEGDVVATKLMTGTANNLVAFDTQGATAHIMYASSLNAGDRPSYYVENWKWYIGSDIGVIVMFKANQDCELTITNTYLKDFTSASSNGWTEDCYLTYYIVRNGQLKKINQVAAPAADEDFNGTYYLKTGDMLYVEFNSSIINLGEIRNLEAPCGTKFSADATKFDSAKYEEQNNDLSSEVLQLIDNKQAALDAWFATLKQEDYSATNWALVQDELNLFKEKCENEVKTAEDVEKFYNETLSAARSVETLAQAQVALTQTLNGYVEELKVEYDKLVAENSYTEEQLARLKQAFDQGKENILACTKKAAGNTAKLTAIAELRNVETASAQSSEEKGCIGSLSSMGIAGLSMAVWALSVALKKKQDR